MDWILQPWPWYVAGPLIGLMVPALLLLGNKQFGISSSLKHVCAATIPGKIKFFNYDWRKHTWSLMFVLGVVIGGFVFGYLTADDTIAISTQTQADLSELGVQPQAGLAPVEIFSWESLGTVRGWIFIVLGGFLVGFGTRYANGCTSGHAIMGLSNLKWPSLVATVSFFVGGLLMTHLLLPYLIRL